MNESINGNYRSPELEVKEENVILGTVGAIAGAVAGAVLIAVLAKVGFVASICGVVMAYLSLFLYAKLAGKMSKKGIIICVVIMIVTVFITEWLIYAYEFYKELKEYGFTFGEVFKSLFDFLKLGEVTGYFVKDILMLYAFTALGAVPQIKNFITKKPEEIAKPVDMTFANGNTAVNTTETIDSDLMNAFPAGAMVKITTAGKEYKLGTDYYLYPKLGLITRSSTSTAALTGDGAAVSYTYHSSQGRGYGMGSFTDGTTYRMEL